MTLLIRNCYPILESQISSHVRIVGAEFGIPIVLVVQVLLLGSVAFDRRVGVGGHHGPVDRVPLLSGYIAVGNRVVHVLALVSVDVAPVHGEVLGPVFVAMVVLVLNIPLVRVRRSGKPSTKKYPEVWTPRRIEPQDGNALLEAYRVMEVERNVHVKRLTGEGRSYGCKVK